MGLYGNTPNDVEGDIITVVNEAIKNGDIKGAGGTGGGAGTAGPAGAKGATGAAGAAGAAGADGADGQDGAVGPAGADATITAVALGTPADLAALITKLKSTPYFK